MTGRAEPWILLAFGVAAVRVGTGSDLAVYVRPGTRWAVVTAAGVILVVAVSGLRRSTSRHGTRLGWLLLAPVLVLTVVAPPPLGALSADRPPVTPPAHDGPFPALPRHGVVPMTVGELVLRSLYGPGSALRGRSLRIVGFVARARVDGFLLARLVITCCAADARPYDIAVTWPATSPARNTWVSVTGTFAGQSAGNRLVPVLHATRVETVDAPAHPYD